MLDDTPTLPDNDLINRQACQIGPQIGRLFARCWIRETLFDVITVQLGYMHCLMAQAKHGRLGGAFACHGCPGRAWHLWSPTAAVGGGSGGWQEGITQSLPEFWFPSNSCEPADERTSRFSFRRPRGLVKKESSKELLCRRVKYQV